MVAKVRKKKRSYDDRRLGRDFKRQSQDINVYRWFAVFIKMALELEGQTFKVHNKIHKVKFILENKNVRLFCFYSHCNGRSLRTLLLWYSWNQK